MLRYLWLAGVVIIADQLSKVAALRYLVPHVEHPLMPLLNLTLTFNRGAAFGFLNDAPGWQNIFFIAIAVAASVAIIIWLKGLASSQRLLGTGLGLILGGAVGNVLDRLFYGYVIDFIDVYVGGWHFWTFNIADSAITLGAAALIFDSINITKRSS